ncbi:MAG TPA: biotin--[acetyl-CoA-carboxylase] ligase [Candidatus Ventrimonas merdavium]|nr:biotin--[acetyl-CoA-carboxylase] ligase [Candidatus Ventrimonas merdavium]
MEDTMDKAGKTDKRDKTDKTGQPWEDRGHGTVRRPEGAAWWEERLDALLATRQAGRSRVLLDTVDSTNQEARRQAEQGAPDGTLVLAEEQTAGKGRRGRSWSSPKGSGIWMSLVLRPAFGPEKASMMTLLAAMAAARGVRETTGLACQIKWPNDLVLNGRKVCGILTEMSTEQARIRYAIVGIGINANTAGFPKELRDTATSLYAESGIPADRALLAASVLLAWEEYHGRFLETMDLSGLLEEYNASLVNRGRQVRVLDPKGEWQGTALGIDREGQLLVQTEDGAVRTVLSGEVSVRGVYGYV